MKSLREVAQIQGFTDSPISVVQLAGKLGLQIPFSLQQVIGRGSYVIDKPIWDKWASLNYENSIGYPTMDTQSTSGGFAPEGDFAPAPDGGFARFNHFERGSIYTYEMIVDGRRRDCAVLDPIRKKWGDLGYENGLGYPRGDTEPTDDGIGLFNEFIRYGPMSGDLTSYTYIYSTSATGAHAMWGEMRSLWLKYKNVLGYPTTDNQKVNGRDYCKFEHGEIVWGDDGIWYVKDQNGNIIWNSSKLTKILVSPSTATLNVNTIQPFKAIASDQNGKPLSGIQTEWATSNPNVGTVERGSTTNTNGEAISIFRALAAGNSTVTAWNGSINGSASVTVNAAPTPTPIPTPTPTSTWILIIQATPIPTSLEGELRIDIPQITWKVTPDWNAGLAKIVNITPTPPTAIGSVELPVPTGAVKTVTVEISGTAYTPGGVFRGSPVGPQNFAIQIDTRKVGFQGSNETISWYLWGKYIQDPVTGDLVFGVYPALVSITP